jgi:catechol 2,3-dioxygenase-like lactoylglutathione lyase family enzyme
MSTPSAGFKCVKVIALSARDLKRADQFYEKTLGLEPAYENKQRIGYLLGETILMLKADWELPPTETPNPRVTIQAENARATEDYLRSRNVVISDPVVVCDEVHLVGSFLDSEGNKVWFCSYLE